MQLLDLQFALAAAGFRVLLGLGDDRRCFAHGVAAPQAVENLDQNERHARGDDAGKDGGHKDDLR